jgi:hypothetical protein
VVSGYRTALAPDIMQDQNLKSHLTTLAPASVKQSAIMRKLSLLSLAFFLTIAAASPEASSPAGDAVATGGTPADNPNRPAPALRTLPAGFAVVGPNDFQEYIRGGLTVLSQSGKWWKYVMDVTTSWRLVAGGQNTSINASGIASIPRSVYESIRQDWGANRDQMYYALAELMIHEASHRYGTNEDQAHATARQGICQIARNARPEYMDFFLCGK